MKLRQFSRVLLVASLAAFGAVGCATSDADPDGEQADPNESITRGDDTGDETVADLGEGEEGEADADESVGQTSEALQSPSSCKTGSGAQLVSAYPSGNFNWTTVLKDTRADGSAAYVDVTVRAVNDSPWKGSGANRIFRYTHKNSLGCGKTSTYKWHLPVDPRYCVSRGQPVLLQIDMLVRTKTRTITRVRKYGELRCYGDQR